MVFEIGIRISEVKMMARDDLRQFGVKFASCGCDLLTTSMKSDFPVDLASKL